MTVRFVERPFRFGKERLVFKTAFLCGLIFSLLVLGLILSRSDLSQSHTCEKVFIKRKGFEHAIGCSLKWYKGKENWLFLGNAYDDCVAKLKLAMVPSSAEVDGVRGELEKIATTAARFGTKVVLLVGPCKSSVYPEYLPDGVVPSKVSHLSFFLKGLEGVTNLFVYNPAPDLIFGKQSVGSVYYKSDTHWNAKGG